MSRRKPSRLTRLRRAIQALAGSYHRIDKLEDEQRDVRLREAMGLMRRAYALLHDAKLDEQIATGNTPTLRDGLAALTMRERDDNGEGCETSEQS